MNETMHPRKFRHRYRQRIYHAGLTLDCLPPGSRGKILSVGGEPSLRRRLLDMGLTPNTIVLVRKVAPLGDPIELFLRNYELTIRLDDARQISIEEVTES